MRTLYSGKISVRWLAIVMDSCTHWKWWKMRYQSCTHLRPHHGGHMADTWKWWKVVSYSCAHPKWWTVHYNCLVVICCLQRPAERLPTLGIRLHVDLCLVSLKCVQAITGGATPPCIERIMKGSTVMVQDRYGILWGYKIGIECCEQ